MSRGQRTKIAIYDDWANIADKMNIDISPITDRTTVVENEIEEIKKEIEQIKEKQQQKRRKIIIRVR